MSSWINSELKQLVAPLFYYSPSQVPQVYWMTCGKVLWHQWFCWYASEVVANWANTLELWESESNGCHSVICMSKGADRSGLVSHLSHRKSWSAGCSRTLYLRGLASRGGSMGFSSGRNSAHGLSSSSSGIWFLRGGPLSGSGSGPRSWSGQSAKASKRSLSGPYFSGQAHCWLRTLGLECPRGRIIS